MLSIGVHRMAWAHAQVKAVRTEPTGEGSKFVRSLPAIISGSPSLKGRTDSWLQGFRKRYIRLDGASGKGGEVVGHASVQFIAEGFFHAVE